MAFVIGASFTVTPYHREVIASRSISQIMPFIRHIKAAIDSRQHRTKMQSADERDDIDVLDGNPRAGCITIVAEARERATALTVERGCTPNQAASRGQRRHCQRALES